MTSRLTFFERLQQAQEKLPELRLGQLIFNATAGADIFYWSDDKLIRTIENYVSAHVDEPRGDYSAWATPSPREP